MRGGPYKNLHQVLYAVLLLVTGAAHAGNALTIEEPWVRFIPGDRPMAGYFVLDNRGDKGRRLVKASSPAFGAVHMHKTVDENGLKSMRPVEALVVPARGQLEFEPGGYHLMLMKRQQDFEVGDELSIRLEFDDGSRISTLFTIKPSWQE